MPPVPGDDCAGRPTYGAGMSINHDGGGLVWMQLADILRDRIAHMERGQLMPSMRSLMQEFEVSDGTVKRAMSQLRSEKLIITYQGRGSFVL
jgi:GntR family transcriptional regulator